MLLVSNHTTNDDLQKMTQVSIEIKGNVSEIWHVETFLRVYNVVYIENILP